MSIITVFSGTFCNADPIVKQLTEETDYTLMSDTQIVAKARDLSGLNENKLMRTFSAKTSIFNQFTHERELSVAYLKWAIAELLAQDNLLLYGFSGQLIPREVSHVLSLCLIGDMKSRVALATKEKGMNESDAIKQIRRDDEDRIAWVETLFRKKDPWDPSLYDILIPSDKISREEIMALVKKSLAKDILRLTPSSKKAVQDFLLAAKVEVALCNEGHNVSVAAHDGLVTITINKHVLMLGRLEEEVEGDRGQGGGGPID